MKTIIEILKRSTDYLQQKGIENARRQAEELLCDALSLQRMQLYLQFERPLIESEVEKCRDAVMRRARGEPSQYIRGEVDFYYCKIKVNSHVLIPRHETEILVDKIAHELENHELKGMRLWDICTGSGCIGIALKRRFPVLDVTLADLSKDSLAVAKENAELNDVNVTLLNGDLLAPFSGMQCDFVVCNPPYISEKEWSGLDAEVRNHEPKMALIGGSTGLEFYGRLAQELPKHLLPNAKIWFELGKGQGKPILELFQSWSQAKCRIEQDWAGHDRFFFLEMESIF